MGFIKNIWKYSRVRFYLVNFIWNIKFWLFAKKIYQNRSYYIESDDFILDEAMRMVAKKKLVTRRRFVGYLFQGALYLDNPGFKIDYNTWKAWRKKKLI